MPNPYVCSPTAPTEAQSLWKLHVWCRHKIPPHFAVSIDLLACTSGGGGLGPKKGL